MRLLRAASAIALFTGLTSIAGTGVAHAASCPVWLTSPRPNAVLGLVTTKLSVSCDVVMPSISVTARLYRYDPVLRTDVLLSTASNLASNTTYVETTASAVCVPGFYHSEGDVAVVWPGGSSGSGSYATEDVLIPCV